MKIYDDTREGFDAPKARVIDNQTLFRGVPWDGTPKHRTELPSDDLIKKAVDDAMADDPVWVYLDDSQRLAPLDVLELGWRVSDLTRLPVGYYGQPTAADPFARNTLRNNEWADRAAAYRWSVKSRYSMIEWPSFAHIFDFACPSLYLKPGTEDHTPLTPAQAWRVASAETLLRAERVGLPIVAFVSIDDPALQGDQDTAEYMAKTLKQWGRDVVVWGRNQNLLAEHLQ